MIFQAVFVIICENYASSIASEGHSAAQDPQLIHLSASIARAPSFSEIASTGQTGSQAPQFTQLSFTLYAIFYLAKIF